MSDALWGKCPRCIRWFLIENPDVGAFHRCPVCLVHAHAYERRIALDDEEPRQE